MKYTIEGRQDKVKRLIDTNRLYLKKNGLKIVQEEEKEEEKAFSVADTVILINDAKTLDELNDYESDTRKGVIKALEAKKMELV